MICPMSHDSCRLELRKSWQLLSKVAFSEGAWVPWLDELEKFHSKQLLPLKALRRVGRSTCLTPYTLGACGFGPGALWKHRNCCFGTTHYREAWNPLANREDRYKVICIPRVCLAHGHRLGKCMVSALNKLAVSQDLGCNGSLWLLLPLAG